MSFPWDTEHEDYVSSLIAQIEKPLAQLLTFSIHYETRDKVFTKWSLLRNNIAADLYTLFTREIEDVKLRNIYWNMSCDLKDHMAIHEDEWDLIWGKNVFKCRPAMKHVLKKKCLKMDWIGNDFVTKY